MDDWQSFDREGRGFYRVRGTTLRGTLKLGDDTQPVQEWQLEGYPTELRTKVQRLSEFGFSSMPLPGAGAQISWHGGHRGSGTITSVEDPRYRAKGLKGGESLGYMVDGADEKGENGTLRKLWQGALGWTHSIFGKTINVGNDTDVQTINVGHSGSLVINVAGGTINLNIPHGDIVVNGISLVHHTHSDPQGGNTGQPT